jgi:opacity protein-like surface antigen
MNLDFESSKVDLGVPGLTFAGIVNPFVGIAASLPGGIGLNAAAEASRLLNTYDPTIGTQNVKFYDAGGTYDPGKWFVIGEVLHQSSKGILGDITSGFVSGGYRWNQFTPYATFAVAKNEERNEPGVPLAGLPPQLQFLGGVVNSLFEGALRDHSQKTYSVGLRWDIASKFALKAQYDYIDIDDDSDGQLTNLRSGFVPGGSVNLISIAVDYVF